MLVITPFFTSLTFLDCPDDEDHYAMMILMMCSWSEEYECSKNSTRELGGMAWTIFYQPLYDDVWGTKLVSINVARLHIDPSYEVCSGNAQSLV